MTPFQTIFILLLSWIRIATAADNAALRWKPSAGAINGTAEDYCVWHTVGKDDFKENKNPYTMCLTRGDFISDYIEQHRDQYWPDCKDIASIWYEINEKIHHSGDTGGAAAGTHKGFMVDAGANIGSCSLLMAANGVHVAAFEPMPSNLYHFTNSIIRNGPPISENLHLYPMGLGESESVHTIFAQKGNQGNSVLDVPVADPNHDINDMRSHNFTIHVHTLDNVLWPNASHPPPMITLMKVDVQGYELKLLQGARRLLEAKAIRVIKSELAKNWLLAQGTSPKEMCDFLISKGYLLATMQRERVDQFWCERYFEDNKKANEVDFLAFIPSMEPHIVVKKRPG